MMVHCIDNPNRRTVSELAKGDTFLNNGQVYMVIYPSCYQDGVATTILLETGDTIRFNEDENVTLVSATISYTTHI